jgi:organic hydroperoxide reductase OsmC/OhrA
MSVITTSQPVIKRKTFQYQTEISWLVAKAGMLESDGKPDLRVSSPPEFHGESGVWTPEDLYVGAINACTMSTFLAFAEKKKLKILSYESKASGILEFQDGKYWFTHVTVKPRIIVNSIECAASAEETILEAHRNCFLSNSIKSIVTIEPDISVRDTLTIKGQEIQ